MLWQGKKNKVKCSEERHTHYSQKKKDIFFAPTKLLAYLKTN
jgi:hypothetical protein